MDRNQLKTKLAARQLTLLAGNFETAEMIDFAGSLDLFDGVWIDMEHGAVAMQSLPDMSRAADLWGLTSIVRVASPDRDLIEQTMVQGVNGVIVPHVTTAETAESVVRAVKVPPRGHRGAHAGRRGYGRSLTEHTRQVNDETFVAVMIEEVAGVNNLAEILAVPDIDMFFVAHYHLAQSMGLGTDVKDPALIETYDSAIATIVAANQVAAAVVQEADLEKYLSMGVLCIKAPGWQSLVASGYRSYVERARAARR